MSTLEAELNKPAERDFYAKFITEPGEDKAASEKAGHAVYADIDYVTILPKGEGGNEVRYRVDRLKKGRPHIWELIQDGYEAYKEGHEDPVDGIPLRGWSGCTEAQRLNLANINVRSVEDLSKVGDDQCQKLPGTHRLRETARNYLAQIKDGSVLVQENAALKERADDQQTLLDAQSKEIDELRQQVNALAAQKKAAA